MAEHAVHSEFLPSARNVYELELVSFDSSRKILRNNANNILFRYVAADFQLFILSSILLAISAK